MSFDACINQHINIGILWQKTFVWQLLSEIQELVPNVTIEEKQGTTGDQYGIFADNTKLQTQLEIDNFVPLKKGLAKFLMGTTQMTKCMRIITKVYPSGKILLGFEATLPRPKVVTSETTDVPNGDLHARRI